MSIELEKELRVAMKLARDAGAAVMARYQRSDLEVQSKGAEGPVTEADRAAHRLITNELTEAFPEDAILSEEGEDDVRRREGARTWIIDPLDGTADFISGNGEFSVLIALVIGGIPMLGVVYQPVGENLFYAVKGQGAFIETGGKPPSKLRVTDEKYIERMTAVVSRNHRSKAIDRMLEVIKPLHEITCGSVGLKMTRLILGDADIYFHPSPKTKVWDTAAPQVLLEEAGGRLTDFGGRPLRYDGEAVNHAGGIAASNGRAHDELLQRVETIAREAGLVF